MTFNRIFGIGLSRTGTTTLSTILKRANLNVVHYPTRQQLFDGINDGASDIPAALEFETLDRVFPGSKFILTTRDRDEWVQSIVPYFERKRDRPQSAAQVKLRTDMYGSPFPTAQEAVKAWDNHHDKVNRYFEDRVGQLLTINIVNHVSPPRLLWEFLKLDGRPPHKFPHENALKK